ncbi:MAG: hypothetical protein KDD22_06060 [Bdellovibrionales bacterium]|nr:hypothetical protein [Bdellovibrionales bacterium]
MDSQKTIRPPIHKRRLLVDKNIQIPLIIYSSITAIIGILVAALFSVLGALALKYNYPTWSMTTFIFLGCLFSISSMVFVGLYITNKVAGPLLRLRENMEMVANGAPPIKLNPREGDYTQSLFEQYNRMIEKIPTPPSD